MANLIEKPWLSQSRGGKVTLVNASVVDVETGVVHPKTTICVADGIIVSLSSSPGPAEAEEETITIDIQGKFVIPGLIDCHVHLYGPPGTIAMRDIWKAQPNMVAYRTTFAAREMLLRGFTTVRDTGGADEALRTAIAEGLIPGPRLFFAGRALSQTGGHGDFRALHEDSSQIKCCGGHPPALGRVCDGVPACLEAARDELRQGADFLKIMCGGGIATPADPLNMLQFTAQEIQAITQMAAFSHTYVTAHAYTNEAIRHAVENGVFGIEHGNFVDQETAEYCAAKGVIFTPTLICYHTMITPAFDGFLTEDGKRKTREVLAGGLQSLVTLKQAGVMMCYGSDMLGGLHPYQSGEFSLRAKVLSPLDVLQSATCNAAKLLRSEGKLGCIKEGAFADLLIVNRNPLEDITILDGLAAAVPGIDAILKEGKVVHSRLSKLEVDDLYRKL